MSKAKGQLLQLVRLAEAGEEVVLTRHGRSVARLIAVQVRPTRGGLRALIEALQTSASQSAQRAPD